MGEISDCGVRYLIYLMNLPERAAEQCGGCNSINKCHIYPNIIKKLTGQYKANSP